MFISLSSTCIQNFSNWYALFVAVVFFITYCSRCSMKWHCVLTHRWSILSFFITCCAEASSAPKQYLFSLGSGKKNILGIHPKMIINPAPFHSKAFVLLYKFETSWALLSRLSRVFFYLPSLGPLILVILNILNNFSRSCLDFACQLCESFLVESPVLYLAFLKTILAALFRKYTNRIFESKDSTTRMKIVN